MTYIIPNQQSKSLKQLNVNDLSGNLFATKNIDLREEGYIKLSHPAVAIYSTTEDSDFHFTNIILKSDAVWVMSLDPFIGITNGIEPLTNRSSDTAYPVVDYDDDAIYFNGKDVVSSGTNLKYRSAATTWTALSPSISLNNSLHTALEVFDKFAALIVGNGNTVQLVNTSWLSFRTLTLPSQYYVTSIAVNDGIAYIGTRHKTNGEAMLFTWDGESSAYNNQYGVNTFEISTVKKYKGSVALITSLGYLLQFNGGGFTELGRFPIKESVWADASTQGLKVSNRGMCVEGDRIYIRIDSSNISTIQKFNPYFPGGIWCYDPNNGLYNFATHSYNRVLVETITTSNVNQHSLAGDPDTFIVTTAPPTGTPVFYDHAGSTGITGLSINTVYYTIKMSATLIKIASTLANALAGTAVQLPDTGNNAQKLYWIRQQDFGQSYVSGRGAIEILPNSLATKDHYADKFFFVGITFSPGVSVANVLSPLIYNRGYFITPRLNSPNDEENYNTVSLKYRPLKTGESIVVKYKALDRSDIPFSSFKDTTYASPLYANWKSTTTFATTADLSNVSIGDEIEVVAGTGSGMLAHVTALSLNAGTYTVTIDEPYIFAILNDIMYFSVDSFQKLLEVTSTNQTAENHTEISLNKNSKFTQFKVELRGVDVAIEEFKVNNQKFKG